MNFDEEFQNIESVKVHRAYSDNAWIDECFENYIKNLLIVVSDYFKCARGVSIVDDTEYGFSIKLWNNEITEFNQALFVNSGKMASIVITHRQSDRAVKLDISSYTDVIVFTAFNKLVLDDDNLVVTRKSSATMAGEGNFYNYQSLAVLGKMYEFLSFGIVDTEENNIHVSLH
jgi:hypothetical protein